jgi:hypothetical protein
MIMIAATTTATGVILLTMPVTALSLRHHAGGHDNNMAAA